MPSAKISGLLLATALVLGCGDGPATGSSGAGSSGTTAASTGGSTGLVDDTAASTGDPVVGTSCDLLETPCPEGYNCLPVGDDGALVCVPTVDEPAGPYMPCETIDAQTDTCEAGGWCILPDADGVGVCSPLCATDFGDGGCGDAALCLSISQGEGVGVCVRGCDPLANDCVGDTTCRAIQMGFYCMPNTGETVATGEPCEPGDCVAGDTCTSAKVLDGCAASMCCARLCDETDPDSCLDSPNGDTCFGLLDDGQPVPAWDVVGVCVLGMG